MVGGGVIVPVEEPILWTPKNTKKCLTQFLKRCQEKGIKLNKEKLELSRGRHFHGSQTYKGLQSDPEKVKAITSMQVLSTVKELRRYLGMVNYVANILLHLHETTLKSNQEICAVVLAKPSPKGLQ
ncbi:hypothetical protein HOLleu_24302 [Holothuria leucospilota]|uniref:Uncharacterized protein n=1 Tax=Holothuria leucospilota TaxID=206669 RepID=A0A9Q1BWL4_HOLLE|nr:hypothetical protein HOLleu_24302 [Holothuria leucospilota]